MMLCEIKISTPEWTEEKGNNLITQFKNEIDTKKKERGMDVMWQ